MSDLLPIFDDLPDEQTKPDKAEEKITESQRSVLRVSFSKLGVNDAPGQFALVKELTGQCIKTVQELEARNARILIFRLEEKVRSIGRKSTGNAWDDREEDTWIDKL